MRETASISSARAGLRPRLGLVIAAAVLSAAAGPAERDRAELKNGAIGNGPPVPLQDARCVLPPALKGVTGHALLSYVVEPSGDVTSIRTVYATASPESRREAFAAALEDCLKPWRYRPRGFHGIAVEESLLIAFHYLEDPAPDAPFIAVGGGRTMPLAHFEEIRREKLKLAASLLAGPGYAEFSGDGWVLRTDVPRHEVDAVVDALRFASRAFETLFPGSPPPPEESKATILLFKDEDEFKEIAAFDNMIRMHFAVAGQYSPEEKIIYTSAGGFPDAASRVLMHEITHHFVCQRLFRLSMGGARKPAFWVNEGIATFIESLKRPRKDKIDLDAIDSRPRIGVGYQTIPHASMYLGLLDGEARATRLATITDYLDPKEGQKLRVDMAYAMSWLMVHYLVNAGDGQYRRSFQRWLMDPHGVDGSAGLAAALGRPFAEIQAELPAHLWRMGLSK